MRGESGGNGEGGLAWSGVGIVGSYDLKVVVLSVFLYSESLSRSLVVAYLRTKKSILNGCRTFRVSLALGMDLCLSQVGQPLLCHSVCPIPVTAPISIRLRIMTSIDHQLTLQVLIARHIDTRIRLEEVTRPQWHRVDLHRHHWPVLHSRVVRQSKHTPHHDVLIPHIVLSCHRIRYTADFLPGLHRVASCGVELVVAVLGHPDVVVRESRALRLDRSWVCEEELGCWGCEFEADRLARDGVCLVLVDDLEDTVGLWFCVGEARSRKWRAADFVEVAARVCLWVHGDGKGVFLDDGVAVAVDGRVDADGEDVLVVLGQNTWADDVAVVGLFAWVDVDDGDDACCASLDVNVTGLIELVGEDVFVISEAGYLLVYLLGLMS